MIPIDPNALYRVEDLVKMLDTCPSAIRNWIRQGRLPAAKLGKSYLIRGADLLALPRAQKEHKGTEEPRS